MKKTLLFFLLLFTNIFYAQVTSITMCESQSFDLTSLKKDFIGNLNPAETTVTYFLSLDDALNNTNIIENPTHYVGVVGPSEIYGRIDYNGTISTDYFNLMTFPSLNVTASHTPIVCSEETSSLTINASGGIGSYQYSINGGPFTSNNYYKYLLAGTYHIEVKDDGRLCSTTIDHIITAPLTLTATAITVNQNTTITAAGGTAPYQYSLDGANYQSSNVFSDLPVGIQPIAVTDANGCSVFNTIVVGDYQLPLGSGGMTIKHLTCWGNAAIRAIGYGGQPPYLYSINGGVTFQTSDTFDNLNAGTYPIAIKDSENTIINNLVIELTPYIPVTCTAVATNTSSCINDGGINIVANGGQIPHYYSIDGGTTYSADNTFFDLPAGNYTVLVKDSNDCVSPAITAKIQQDPQLSATASHTELLCAQDKTSLIINATGGEAPYQYSINNLIYKLSNTYTDLSPGTYQIKVKDAVGCITTLEHIIVQPVPVNVSAVITKEIDCISNASITANATGGKAPYSYSIDGGINYISNTTFTNVLAGTYQITAKDSNGCLSQITITVTPLTALIGAAAITRPLSCNGPASIQATATGGTKPYLYSINNGSYSGINIFYEYAAGTYVINIKDAAGCIVTRAITIAPLTTISSVALPTNASCSGNPDGSIVVMANGGVAPYTYSLNNVFQRSNVFNNLLAGNYAVTVKDNLGCINRSQVVIGVPKGLTINATTTNTKCYNSADGAISLSVSGGTGAYTYSLDGGVYQSGNTFNYLTAGYHTINIQDAKGCITSYSATITKPDLLATTIAVNTVFFNDGTIGGTITLNSSGGFAPYTYTIKNNDTGVIKVNNNPATVYSGLPSGSYTITTKDANGCQTENDIRIMSRTPMVITAANTPINCKTNNAVITATVSEGIPPYLYSIDGFNFTTNNTFTVTGARTYTISVEDSLGIISNINHIVKPYVPVTMTANLNYYTASGNVGGQIALSSSGGTAPYSYTLKNNATGLIVFENYTSTIYAGLPNGSYSIYSKDANGCESERKDITVVVPEPILITAVHTPPTCINNNSNVIVTATGGTAPYLYSYNLGTTYTAVNTVTLEPGNYLIEVKDAVGNTSRIHYLIAPYADLKLNLTKTDVNCFGLNDGSITAIATGGVAPYTYSLNNNSFSSSNIFNYLAAGNYLITVKDAVGCLTNTVLTIVTPTILVSTATVTTAPNGTINNGKIAVTATGGTLPYIYFLTNYSGTMITPPQASNIFTGIAAGLYQVQVTDSRGCTTSQSIAVEASSMLSATVNVTPITCNTTGSIIVTAAGGTAPYEYSKDDSTFTSSNVFSGLIQGIYNIYVRDVTGYIVVVQIAIMQEPVLSISVNLSSEISCSGANNGRISLTIKDGKAPYYVSLDHGPYTNFGNSTVGVFENLRAGTHTISVKDTYGCIVTGVTTVVEPTPLITTIQVENQSVSVTAFGGSAPYRYAISPNLNEFSTNNVFTNLTPGLHQVIVQDKNGCFVVLDASIDTPAPLINDEKVITIEFTAGQTLGDLVVEGQNIKWYSSANNVAKKTNKTNEATLPLSTLLVNGTTYYASQTINGIESTKRLAVTAKLNSSLATPDFTLPNLSYYPNPVQHTLSIHNTSNIDEVEIFSVAGKSVLTKKVNSDHSEIDLSNVPSGVYFLKVKAEGKTKTIKIVKK